MAITQNTYTGNGSTTNYSFTFPYLETTDIKASINGILTTSFTLANATTVSFNTPPANGASIRIFRSTDTDSLKATFYPGSAIRSSDLNASATQVLYSVQETSGSVEAALTTSSNALSTANSSLTTANTALSTSNTALANSTSIGTSSIQDGAVTTTKLANGISPAKLSTTGTNVILGRSTAGAGAVEEIACTAAGRALIDDLTASDQRTTLGLGNSATRNVGTTAGTVAAGDDARLTTDLSYTASTRLLASSTGADVTLPLFTSTDAGLVPQSSGGTTTYLRADGTWGVPTGGTQAADLLEIGNTRVQVVDTGTNGYFFIQTEGVERLRVDNQGYPKANINGLGDGRIPALQYYRLNSTLTGNLSGTTNILNVGVTLVGSTVYEFEGVYLLNRAAGTNTTLQLGFGGTATINNITYQYVEGNNNGSTSMATSAGYLTTATATSIGITTRNDHFIIVRGTVSVNAGGTFIPQYGFTTSTNTAYTTLAGTSFRIYPLGSSGANTSIGTWS